MARAIKIQTELTGSRPLGWYTGRTSPNTARLVAEEGGFLYDSDSYADELPYYDRTYGSQMILPYTLDANDMRFCATAGFFNGDAFFHYLKDSFDQLYEEGEIAPKLFSVGLHCRLAGRPGRVAALEKFLDYVLGHEHVWICRRVEIARHWIATHPYAPPPESS